MAVGRLATGRSRRRLLSGAVRVWVALAVATAGLAALPVAAPETAQGLTGPTWVPDGPITSSRTWGPEGSPYVVDGTVQIQAGATLTILPGTVVKFFPTTERSVNPTAYDLSGITVYGGRLVARGTAAEPVVFTSYHDDSAGGDTDGSGRALARGDWMSLRFSAPNVAAAVEMPVSVLDNVLVRYGGEGGSAGCSAGHMVDVAGNGRLHLSRAELTDAQTAGLYVDKLTPAVGVAMVSNTRFADSGCGAYLQGGDLVNNVFEATLSKESVYANAPQRLRLYGNWLHTKAIVSVTDARDREQADLRNNALVGGVLDMVQDHVDLAHNWWGPNPPQPGDCYVIGATYVPSVVAESRDVPCSLEHRSYIKDYFTKVTPMLGSAPPVPQTGPGADPSAPAPVPAAQVLGAVGGSEYAGPARGAQADPVSSATGSFVAEETDAAVPAVGIPLVVARTYNSADSGAGWLGRGWSFGYQTRLVVAADESVVVLHAEDGQQVRFDRAVDGSYLGAPGTTATLTRDAQGRWVLTTRALLRRVFSATGRLLAVSDRNGNRVELTYDAEGRLVTASNGGRALTFAHDPASGRITQVAVPDGRTVGYSYTGELLTSVRDLAGRITRYSYDGSGRLASVTDPSGTETMRLGYHPSTGRVSDQWDALGNRTQFAWDPATQTATMTDPRGGVWTDRYQDNLLIERVTASGAATTYTYDARLQLVRTEGPRGVRNTFGYSEAGDLTSFTGPAGTVSTTYDTNHNPTSSVNGRGFEVRYRYDTAGNLVAVDRPDPADPNGALTTGYGYDTRGLLVSVTDPVGRTTNYSYTPAGDLATATSPGGSRSTFDHDTTGRLTSTVEPRGNEPGATPAQWTTYFTYTDDDRPATSTNPLGHSVSWAYDTDGRLQSATDPRGNLTSYSYDDAGHLTAVQGPDPAIPPTRYGYDTNGNPVSITDTAGRATSYTYDLGNRPTRAVTPIGTYQYAYDQANNLTQVTDPAGKVTKLVHDAANRLITIDYPAGTTDVSYRYDANGNRTSMSDAAGTASYRYDKLDRLTAVTRGSKTFSYGYHPSGTLAQVTYPDATTYSYAYDTDHRLDTVTSGGTGLADYGHDAAGHLVSLTRGNQTAAQLTYDRIGRLTQIRDTRTSDATVLLEETYQYDAAGNLTRLTDATGTATSYGYDTLDRLLEACYGTTTCDAATDYVRWAYDAAGNRTSETRPTGTTSYTYAPATGLLTSSAGPSGTTSYSYDALGQLKTQTTGTTTTSYAYNAAGRVTSQTTGTTTTSYTYDGDGRRLSATDAGVRTDFTWLPASYQLATETNADGTLIRRYVYGAGRIGVERPTGGRDYYHLDRQGSVRTITDPTGQPQWSYAWEPYGVNRSTVQHTPGAAANPIGWAGEYADPTGLVHLRARQYDPTTGRFTTPDPAGAASASATYTYAAANPLSYADPYGLWPDWAGIGNTLLDAAPAVSAVAGTLALIPSPASPVFGGIAVAAGAVTAADAGHQAYQTCSGDQKGTCAGAIATAAFDTTLALPGTAWGGAAVHTWWQIRRASKIATPAAKGADEAGALVRYDPEFASRNLLGQVGEGYARTPSGYTVSAHAAERIVYGAPGRSPTTLSRVDDILNNNPTRTMMRPNGTIRVFQGKDWVAVRDTGSMHIVTVMVR